MEGEKMRVLNMVSEGKISVDEALKVIEALEAPIDDKSRQSVTKAKWLKIRVGDTKTGKSKVSVNLPMGLVDWALRTGNRFVGADLDGAGVDLNELRNAINYGLRGKIVDVTDEEKGEQVELVVE